jgi:hypothetical protein
MGHWLRRRSVSPTKPAAGARGSRRCSTPRCAASPASRALEDGRRSARDSLAPRAVTAPRRADADVDLQTIADELRRAVRAQRQRCSVLVIDPHRRICLRERRRR